MNRLYKFKEKLSNNKFIKFYCDKLHRPIKFISTAISWTVFAILIVCATFLLYYFISLQMYAKKGVGYEPRISLYTIISGSMLPEIDVYDVVFVVKQDNPNDIKVGDVISFNSTTFRPGENISVTHRVIEILVDKNGEYSYYTKGDNNLVRDPSPVKFSNVTGTVEMKIPQLGQIQFFLSSNVGFLILIVIPAVYVLTKYLIKTIKRLVKIVKPKIVMLPIFKKQKLLTYKELNTINYKDDIIKSEIDVIDSGMTQYIDVNKINESYSNINLII